MSTKDFIEEFKQLNGDDFYYITDESTSTLVLDDDIAKWDKKLKLPEGCSFGFDSGKTYIYDKDKNKVIYVEYGELDKLFGESYDEDEEETIELELIDEEDNTLDSSDQNELDLKDEEIEDVPEKVKKEGKIKKLFSRKNKKDSKENNKEEKKSEKKEKKHPIKNFFKNIGRKIKYFFGKRKDKTEYDLKNEKIEDVTSIQKKGLKKLFSKKDKNVIVNAKSETKSNEQFENLHLEEKIEKFLEDSLATDDDLIDIYKKIEFITDNNKGMRNQISSIHKFLNENIGMEPENRLDSLTKFIDKKCLVIYNFKTSLMKYTLDNHGLTDKKEITNLFNEIINSDDLDNVQRLYNFITQNNDKENFEENLLKVMKSILKIPVETKLIEKDSEPSEKDITVEPKGNNEINTVESSNTKNEVSTEIKDKKKTTPSQKFEEEYKRYNYAQNKLNNKLAELEYLKNEYNIIEKAIYGKKSQKLTTEKKQELTLLAPKEKLELLREKLQEIKMVEKEIDMLCSITGTYIAKYGTDIEDNYQKDYTKSFDSELFNKELSEKREEKMNDSLDIFNNFNDQEIAAVYKYMDYQKNLK